MTTTSHQSVRSAVAAFIGTSCEWYDFFLYGTAATLVFPKLIFSNLPPPVAVLVSLSTFAVSFVMRPIGGFVFGHFGDRVSRQRMLVVTLSITGVGTVLIGCLPTYQQAGVWAPLLLVFLRMAQGFGLGGEWGGAALVAVENAPAGRRGLFGSSMQMGVPAGLLLSTAAFDAVAALPDPQFYGWGWRVPFLCSFVLLLVGLYIRLRVAESAHFRRVVEARAQARIPLVDVIVRAWRPVLLLIFVQSATNIGYYIFTTYSVVYVTGPLHLPRTWVLNGLLVAAAADLVAQPLFGALSDRLGRRAVFAGGAACIGLWGFAFFPLAATGNEALLWLALVVSLGLGHASTSALLGPLYSEQFPTRLRYTGASLGFQLSGVVTAAPAPALAAALFAATGTPIAVAVYIAVAAAVSIGCVIALGETRDVDLGAGHPREEARAEELAPLEV
jgi:MFS family permease